MRETARESSPSRGELKQFALIKEKKNAEGERGSSSVIAPINDDRGRKSRVPRTGRAEDSLNGGRSFLSGDSRDFIPAGEFAEHPDAVVRNGKRKKARIAVECTVSRGTTTTTRLLLIAVTSLRDTARLNAQAFVSLHFRWRFTREIDTARSLPPSAGEKSRQNVEIVVSICLSKCSINAMSLKNSQLYRYDIEMVSRTIKYNG